VRRKAIEVTPIVNGGAPIANGGALVANDGALVAQSGASVSYTAVSAVNTEGSETVGSVTPTLRSEITPVQFGIAACQTSSGNPTHVNGSATSEPASFTGAFRALLLASPAHDGLGQATYRSRKAASTCVRRPIHHCSGGFYFRKGALQLRKGDLQERKRDFQIRKRDLHVRKGDLHLQKGDFCRLSGRLSPRNSNVEQRKGRRYPRKPS